jgi:aryl-alcohol dehydrogenase-like predicted oxidoreductase
VGGDGHHFRYIQLPFNLAMSEALTLPVEDDKTLLELADELGVTVIASASILQGRLSVGLPERLAEGLQGLATDAQRAIQFSRSAPGITVALVGMSRVSHVAENLGLSTKAPSSPEEYSRLFR